MESEQDGYRFVDTAAAWIDLLGYGDELTKLGYNLDCSEGNKLIARAFTFQQALYNQPRKTRIVVVNDGALISADLEKAGDSYGAEQFFHDPLDFVKHILHLHKRVNKTDKPHSDAGARAVVCRGRRVLRGEGVPNPQRKSIKNWLSNIGKGFREDEKRDAYEAKLRRMIAEANDPTVVCTTHMQHSDAFSRAYYAESCGKKIGLEGPYVFVDSRLLPDSETLKGSLTLTPVPLANVLGQDITFIKVESAAPAA